MRLVNSPTIESVDSFVVDHFLENSCLVSDCHSSNTNIKQGLPNIISDNHRVNHSIKEFKNSQGFTTNLIKSIWSELKTFCPTPGNYEYLATMVDLFIFKKNNSFSSEKLFDQILELLKISSVFFFMFIRSLAVHF